VAARIVRRLGAALKVQLSARAGFNLPSRRSEFEFEFEFELWGSSGAGGRRESAAEAYRGGVRGEGGGAFFGPISGAHNGPLWKPCGRALECGQTGASERACYMSCEAEAEAEAEGERAARLEGRPAHKERPF